MGRVGKVQWPPSAGASEFQAKFLKIDLQILGCELHKNFTKIRLVVGLRPDPLGSYSALQAPSRYKDDGRRRKGLRIGRWGKGGRE